MYICSKNAVMRTDATFSKTVASCQNLSTMVWKNQNNFFKNIKLLSNQRLMKALLIHHLIIVVRLNGSKYRHY